MDIQGLKDDRKFESWHEYEPIDTQYVRYIMSDPSVLAAGHKINDVYHAFCDARGSLLRANYSNYGDLCSNDDISRLYIRTEFLKNALMEYAICFDLSWQVIWAFIQPSSFKYLVQKKYEEMESACTLKSVIAQLDCAIAQNIPQAVQLKDALMRFGNDPIVKRIRKIYNITKHRGMMYFRGFCKEDISKFLFDKNIEMPLQREAYEPDEIEALLLAYHEKFEDYFNEIIQIIMPADYKNTKVDVIDYISMLAEIQKIREEQ